MSYPETLGTIPSLEEIAIPITAPVEEGPPDIIPGLLPKAGQLVIAGKTNVGKSLLALEICSTLSTGTPLWGLLNPTVRSKRILYILGEHYDGVIQRLFQKTQLPMGDVWLLGPEKLGIDKWLVIGGKPNAAAMLKFERWVHGVDLVVFDPLSSFICGVDAENDNLLMRSVIEAMTHITQAVGASCLILAHQGKPQLDQFGREHSRGSYAIRGASAIEDASTNIFYLDKSDSPAQSIGDGMLLDLKCRKYKGEAPPEYRLLRDPETLTHTLLGNKTVFKEVQKFEYRAKIARIRESNPGFDDRTAIKVLASVEGMPVETLKKRLGLTLKEA